MSKTIYVRWSSSDVWQMTFIRWQRKRFPKSCGKLKQKNGFWGIGAVVKFNLLTHNEARKASRREHLPPLHTWLAPHTELYLTEFDARINSKKNIMKRPTETEYIELINLQKKLKPLIQPQPIRTIYSITCDYVISDIWRMKD